MQSNHWKPNVSGQASLGTLTYKTMTKEKAHGKGLRELAETKPLMVRMWENIYFNISVSNLFTEFQVEGLWIYWSSNLGRTSLRNAFIL